MEQAVVNVVANYGVLGIIFLVFIKSYYEDKKESKDFKLKQIEHEKDLAVILSQTKDAMQENKRVIKNTEKMHEDLDDKIVLIDQKLNKLIESDNQVEIIKTVNSIRDMLQELFS